jgi:hypothetical protein
VWGGEGGRGVASGLYGVLFVIIFSVFFFYLGKAHVCTPLTW